jgi:hypothetical protein
MASAPRDRRPPTRQARCLAVVTLLCLVLVVASSAVLRPDAWMWLAWAALALITAAYFALRA